MGTNNLAHALAHFALFAGLDQQTRLRMAVHMHQHTYSAGQVIVLAGEPSYAVHLIGGGEVRVQRSSPEGREYVLHTLGPGQCFNLASALDGGRNLATVSALTDVTVYAIPSDVFRQVVREHPRLTSALLGYLASRVRHLSDAVEDLALYTVRTRLARRLLAPTEGDAPAIGDWTHEELAAQIGTVRDVVGRALRSFSREGLIRRERGRFVVADLAGLERAALRDQDSHYTA